MIPVGQYLELTKPRVVALLVFTAVIGMFLAVPGLPPWRPALFGALGIWLAASSAAAINHLLDRRIDAVMARTAHRPLPTGGLTTTQVLVFALALGILSMALLVWQVNVLTAVLTFFVALGTITVLMKLVRHMSFLPFAVYRVLLGAVLLGLIYSGIPLGAVN